MVEGFRGSGRSLRVGGSGFGLGRMGVEFGVKVVGFGNHTVDYEVTQHLESGCNVTNV